MKFLSSKRQWRYSPGYSVLDYPEENIMSTSNSVQRVAPRRNPIKIWQQGQADAEQIPECRELFVSDRPIGST